MAPIGYARASTVGQDLDAQLEQLQAAGADNIFREKASRVREDRSELAAMLEYAREWDTVVISKLDRIARSTKHLLAVVGQLQEKGQQAPAQV